MATIAQVKVDLKDLINANTGDESALRLGTEEIVDYLFDNCIESDLNIIGNEIGIVCRRHKDEE